MSERFLAGGVAMVTGGTSSIGRAMPLAFAQLGEDVAIGSLWAESDSTATDGKLVHKPPGEQLATTKRELESRGVWE